MRWVFRICEKLGIDDPIYWMEMVDPKLIDMWIGYLIQEEESGRPTSSSAEQMQQQVLGAFGG